MAANPASPLPPHVDEARVRAFDLYKTSAEDGDYHRWYHHGFQGDQSPEIFWTTANGGHWVATRGADFLHFIGKPDLYSSSINVVPRERNFGVRVVPLNMDPPEHTQYRALFTGAFSPKNVMPLGEAARKLTIELVEGFQGRGECEFMGEFAYHLPISIFMNMVGLPRSEREKLLPLVEGTVRPEDPDDRTPFMALAGYAMETILARRAHPGEDLLSQLVVAQVNGQPLTDEELVGMLLLLLLGGLDTVAATLGYVVRYLAREPEVRHQLKALLETQPASAQSVVEELFRRFPVSTLVRVVTQDHEYKGIGFRAGDLVCCYSGAHSLDDREFPAPLVADLTRKSGYHGGFGYGPHRCLGSMLARVEMKVFLEEWLKRIPDFEIPAEAVLRTRPGLVVALEALPLRWAVG